MQRTLTPLYTLPVACQDNLAAIAYELLLTPYTPSNPPKPGFKQRAAFRRRYS